MPIVTIAKIDEEIERILEARSIPQDASRDAVYLMAERWLGDQLRKRDRAEARKDEKTATRGQPGDETLARVLGIALDLAANKETTWEDLLDSAFALADGTRVLWRWATVEQHEQRAEMLELMAAGDIETASLHRSAVSTILGSAATCLEDALR